MIESLAGARRPFQLSWTNGRGAKAVCAGILLWFCCTQLTGAEPESHTAGDLACIQQYRSTHFVLHTDLDKDEAEATLKRMERVLHAAARYWGRPARGPIACYLADRPAAWPADTFPNPLVPALLTHVGGATERVVNPERRTSHTAQIYATTMRGVIEHEVVHAYCIVAFGAFGPDWYKEGIAEVAAQASTTTEVGGSDELFRVLRQEPRRSVQQVVAAGRFTEPLFTSFQRLARLHEQDPAQSMVMAWRSSDSECVEQARAMYYWSWSLCHFLSKHPAYRQRFRMLGRCYLRNNQVDFQQAFGAVMDQLQFEYDQFIRHLAPGYRVDLCAWDWQRPFSPLTTDQKRITCVQAAAGFQPSGVTVTQGSRYRYQATGQWQVAANQVSLSANGASNHSGRLVGAILQDFQLSEPFFLGSEGTFVAPEDGDLYLRCKDRWDELADNVGSQQVLLQLAE